MASSPRRLLQPRPTTGDGVVLAETRDERRQKRAAASRRPGGGTHGDLGPQKAGQVLFVDLHEPRLRVVDPEG